MTNCRRGIESPDASERPAKSASNLRRVAFDSTLPICSTKVAYRSCFQSYILFQVAAHESIYVVDNDPSARDGFARLLRTAGYTVHAFESLEALANWRDTVEGGCLVMDVCMPGFPINDLPHVLSEEFRTLPIVFVSAKADPETRKRAKSSRASAFFHKPVDGPALLDAIEWAMQSNRGNIKR